MQRLAREVRVLRAQDGNERAEVDERQEEEEDAEEESPGTDEEALLGIVDAPRPGHGQLGVERVLSQVEQDRIDESRSEARRERDQDDHRRVSEEDAQGQRSDAREDVARSLLPGQVERQRSEREPDVQPQVAAEERRDPHDHARDHVTSARRSLDPLHGREHGQHGQARLEELPRRRHPHQEEDADRHEQPSMLDRSSRREQAAGQAQRGEDRARRAHGDEPVAEDRRPPRAPQVTARIVGAKVAHRQLAGVRSHDSVPQERFVLHVEADVALQHERERDEHEGDARAECDIGLRPANASEQSHLAAG